MHTFIARPTPADYDRIRSLLEVTIQNTFRREGIDRTHSDDLQREIAAQVAQIERDLNSGGAEVHFLVARNEQTIVGTAAFGPANDIIRAHLALDFTRIPEIQSVYVRPSSQGQGIGTQLYRAILIHLQERAISEFVLDSGYREAQTFWRHRLGEPTRCVRNYWGPRADHHIWHRAVTDCLDQEK